MRSFCRHSLVIAAALAAAFLAAAHAQSNLLLNGSFEQYNRPLAQWTAPGIGDYDVAPGSTNIPGWSVINGPVSYIRGWPAADGTSSIDLSGGGNPVSGGVAQTVATTVGKKYSFSFSMSGNPGASFPPEPSQKRMLVRIGSTEEIVSYDTAVEGNSYTDMKWRRNQRLYVAPTNLTRIEFINVVGTNFTGPVLDNVVLVECAPPPLSITLFGTGAVVSWQDTVCPVVLETASAVGNGAAWQSNAIPAVRTGGRWAVTNLNATTRFFRLRSL